ncbi:hypothetical protein [Arthrospira platensis]|nr:hypothetical protein [Arthrospira platensis]AMW28017.1 hypothetical protein AP285_08550 [Arthrospira platensis YZ]KDR54553.1 hypothetical protein APPUASWS_029050 [Arthrospira platensis str. Paraca]MBD2711994.1 hypothetical protein [Arthrospira platensis FACHB-835]BAI89795.1 hypothetical protein NIES39_D03770 [Arthrospira platensis NIES-39]MBD2574894.1 hypothetical protein [Arthrospira platensis FACHB-971]
MKLMARVLLGIGNSPEVMRSPDSWRGKSYDVKQTVPISAILMRVGVKLNVFLRLFYVHH